MPKAIIVDMQCMSCNCKTHSLLFRKVENNLVYLSKRCTHCKRTFNSNCTFQVWQDYIKEHDARLEMTKHHRKCKFHGGSDNQENISMVPRKKHEAWHTLWGCRTVEKIIEEMNNVWLPPNVKLQIIKQ